MDSVPDCVKSVMARIPYVEFKPDTALTAQAPEFYVFVAACVIVPLLLLKLLFSGSPKYKLPPSPPAYPLIGHLHLLGNLPHQSMANLSKKYGEIYSLRLGSVPAIVVTTPEMAREFLQTQDKCWASRTVRIASAYYFSYNYTGIAFAPYTPVWRNLRKICMLELFTQRRMEASQGVRDEEMRYMIRQARPSSSIDRPVRKFSCVFLSVCINWDVVSPTRKLETTLFPCEYFF